MSEMVKKILNNKESGVSLVELVVVLSIIGILAAVGVPQYGIFIAKSSAKKSTTDLLQNIRLARTMAIKENRTYLITFNEGETINYRIGVDGDNNNSLMDDGVDDYGGGDVRSVDISTAYGNNVVLGTDNFTTAPLNGPNGVAVVDAASFQFNPDGSTNSTGIAYLQHNRNHRGYTYCVELANASGMVNLYMWQGDAYHTTETAWTEIR
jgi:prepilin-type N-terminal cleavage/methylation domain-containing protein